MTAQLQSLALLLQATPQRASLRIFAAMWLVVAFAICIYVLRHLTKRSRSNAPLRPGETQRGPGNSAVVLLAAAAVLLLGVLVFVIMRG